MATWKLLLLKSVLCAWSWGTVWAAEYSLMKLPGIGPAIRFTVAVTIFYHITFYSRWRPIDSSGLRADDYSWLLLGETAVTILSDISFVFFPQTVWFMSPVGWLSWGSFSTAPLINSALFSDRQLCPQMHKTAMCFMANFTGGRIY